MKIYKVCWRDPASHIDTEIKKTLIEYSAVRASYGYIVEDTTDWIAIVSADVVENQGKDDKDMDFTVIPKSLIVSKECFGAQKTIRQKSQKEQD